MATNPNDRMALNPGERPISTDINQLQSNNQRSLMWFAQALSKGLIGAAPAGAVFIADGFSLTAPGGTMNVTLNPGLGFYYNPSDVPTGIGGLSGVDDVSPLHPLPLATAQTIAVPAADPSNPRIDIIEVTTDRRLEQPQSRDILNPGTGVITPASVNKVLAFYLDGREGAPSTGASTTGIGYKKGTPAGSPVAPTATSGYTVVCQILVPAAATQIVQGNVTDKRIDAFPAVAHGTSLLRFNVRNPDTDTAINLSAGFNKIVFPSTHALTIGTALTSDSVGRITVARAGAYRLFAAGYAVGPSATAGSPAITLQIYVYKNGSPLSCVGEYAGAGVTGNFPEGGASGETVANLVVGDFIEAFYGATLAAGGAQLLEAQLVVQAI